MAISLLCSFGTGIKMRESYECLFYCKTPHYLPLSQFQKKVTIIENPKAKIIENTQYFGGNVNAMLNI